MSRYVSKQKQHNSCLIDARKAKGYDQQTLAMLSGIPQSMISRYENLQMYPSSEHQRLISQAVDMPVTVLFSPDIKDITELVSHRAAHKKKTNKTIDDISR